MSNDRKETCRQCGYSLPLSHSGPCPICGTEGKDISITVADNVTLSESFSLTRESRKEFYKKNPKIQTLIFIISFGSPFLGLFLTGITGVIVGLFFSALTYVIAPAVIKVIRNEKETTHYR